MTLLEGSSSVVNDWGFRVSTGYIFNTFAQIRASTGADVCEAMLNVGVPMVLTTGRPGVLTTASGMPGCLLRPPTTRRRSSGPSAVERRRLLSGRILAIEVLVWSASRSSSAQPEVFSSLGAVAGLDTDVYHTRRNERRRCPKRYSPDRLLTIGIRDVSLALTLKILIPCPTRHVATAPCRHSCFTWVSSVTAGMGSSVPSCSSARPQVAHDAGYSVPLVAPELAAGRVRCGVIKQKRASFWRATVCFPFVVKNSPHCSHGL